MDPEREQTLQALAELVREARSGTCWDSTRAEELLRRQSSIEELTSLGIGSDVIEAVWGEAR
jgi:hypothetical protein